MLRQRVSPAPWVAKAAAAPALCGDRRHQRLDADDIHHPREIVGSTCSAISVATFGSVFMRRCVAPMRALSVPKGCSAVPRRARMASGFSSSRRCTASSTCSCSQRVMRRCGPVVHCRFRGRTNRPWSNNGAEFFPFFACIAIGQLLAGRTTIDIVTGKIHEVLFAKAGLSPSRPMSSAFARPCDAGLFAGQDFHAREVAAVSDRFELVRLQHRLRLLRHVCELRAVVGAPLLAFARISQRLLKGFARRWRHALSANAEARFDHHREHRTQAIVGARPTSQPVAPPWSP